MHTPETPERRTDNPFGALRRALGIDRLVLEIHDASFPGDAGEDVGRGSPYSNGARRFLAWARAQGFDGVQLGPQGQTTLHNPSPYDGRVFGRDFQSVALAPLVENGSLAADTLRALAGPQDGRVHPAQAWAAMTRALGEVCGGDEVAIQVILEEQHARLRAEAGLRLYGDLQIGMAPEDVAAHGHLFLPGWLLGAPPSRTNPDGQPWGYPVFDPRRRPEVLAFIRARARWLASGFDGLRIDHPHGLVCPWVYREGQPVAAGARLFESPDIPDLAPFAIARPDQIDETVPRHADGRVRALDDAQVARYAEIVDAIVAETPLEIVAEVLSTLPYPLARVLERHHLGRWRVTQKLSLDDPGDVYRIERAEPADWIMAGNHDTAPVWRLVAGWPRARWAAYLGELLGQPVAPEPDPLIHALYAAMFASKARHVQVFFPDLLGMTDIYNRPGVVHEGNWTLRVPPDYASRPPALDLGRALAMAAHARGLI